MGSWDPNLYLKFGAERTQPAWDLARRLAAILGTRGSPLAPAILDLGCGPGNSAAVLAALWPGSLLVGLDSSPDMIEAARRSPFPAEWAVADASTWEPGRSFDAVFSNAALQWIPDQAGLLERAWSWLVPGGALAFQVPGNEGSPLHRAVKAQAASPSWSGTFLHPVAGHRGEEPDFYYEVLAPFGGELQVWETTYWHLLPGHGSLLEWYRGTGLRPWLEALPDEESRSAFVDELLEAVRKDYPSRADGSVFFPFRRIFFTATKPD